MSANIPEPRNESERAYGDVAELVDAYFHGLHNGDVTLLASAFDSGAWLQSTGLRLSRDEWLERVSTRQSPAELGHAFDYEVLDVDVDGDQGGTKLWVPLLGKTYVDYLSLLREGGRWRIVNKLYLEA